MPATSKSIVKANSNIPRWAIEDCSCASTPIIFIDVGSTTKVHCEAGAVEEVYPRAPNLLAKMNAEQPHRAIHFLAVLACALM